MLWDIFCQVIDNHGDAGVCWRLSAELAARGERVRLWIDDPAPLGWMAPGGAAGVEVVAWHADSPPQPPGDVLVEAFGCDPLPAFVAQLPAAMSRPHPPVWLNLEYLSAEGYVERSHGLPSPVSSGPGAGCTKHFFYPGFTAATGGLLRERDLPARQAAFDAGAWLRGLDIDARAGRCISLFCYEPQPLAALLAQLAQAQAPTQLLATAGRAAAATRQAMAALDAQQPGWNAAGRLHTHWLPLLSQRDYDHLLWACDFNFVRGEDSLVRALWAGKPFAWQLYPQDDLAHHAKLQAFLQWLQPAPDLARLFAAWNGVSGQPLPPLDLPAWQPAAGLARQRACALPELGEMLLRFALERARI